MNAPKLLSRKEVATWLGISLATLDRWVAEEQIPVIRFGEGARCRRVLFDQSDLVAWLATKKTAVAAASEKRL